MEPKISDATKLGNNIFVKTGTDSLTFAASNGMFSNQGGSLVQGGSVIAGKIDNANTIGGLHLICKPELHIYYGRSYGSWK